MRMNIPLVTLGTIIVALCVTLGVMAACSGSDSGSGSAGNLQTITTTFDNGDTQSTGQVDAEGQKQGVWKLYDESGQMLFTGSYADGTLDHSQPWTEYNADGSVRYDQTDGEHPDGGPVWP